MWYEVKKFIDESTELAMYYEFHGTTITVENSRNTFDLADHS